MRYTIFVLMLDYSTPFFPLPGDVSPDDEPVMPDDVDILSPAILRAEIRLRVLARVTEIGMELMETLNRRAVAEEQGAVTDTVSTVINGDIGVSAKSPAPKPPRSDPAEAFAKLSRAVRLTVTLEVKADEALRRLQAGEIIAHETRRGKCAKRAEAAAVFRHQAARGKIEDRVASVIRAEAESETDCDDLFDALDERIEDDVFYDDLQDRPLREIVERLCEDLGLSPDWSRWIGDDWTEGDKLRRLRCSGFSQPSRKPLYRDEHPDPPPNQH